LVIYKDYTEMYSQQNIKLRIATLFFITILRNGGYHLTTLCRFAEHWNPQLQIHGNLTALTFENIIFIIQLLPDRLYFIFVLFFRFGTMRPKTQSTMWVRS